MSVAVLCCPLQSGRGFILQAKAGILHGTRDLINVQHKHQSLARSAIQAFAHEDVTRATDTLREPLRALQSVAAQHLSCVRALHAALQKAGQCVFVELVRRP
jgi:hypothetical protein